MRVPIGDFKFTEEDKAKINEIIESNRISEGRQTATFEHDWANYIGTKECVACSSGSAALMLALRVAAMDRFSTGYVITTPLTYIATSNAIVNTGYQPLYADVDLETFSLTAESVREVLLSADKEVSGVLPVHLMGYPAEVDEIKKICNLANIWLIEDAAQAHGTIYKGKKLGSFGDFSTYSFYVAHNLSVGELGAVNVNDVEFAKAIRSLKANGRMCNCKICTAPKYCPYEGKNPRFTHIYTGYNFKTTEFPTALAQVQLKHIEEIKKQRLENLKYYNYELEGINGLKLPKVDENVSYLGYPLIATRENREEIMKKLDKAEIETRPLFGCIPTQQHAYKNEYEKYKRKLPNAQYLGRNGFYIGVHQHLTKEQKSYVVKKIKEVFK